MDSKGAVPPEQNPPYASGQSGLFVFCFLSSSSSFVSVGLNRVRVFNRMCLLIGKTYASVVAAAAGGAVSSAKSQEFDSEKEAVAGDSDKGVVGGADKEEEVGADEKVGDEAETASSVSPEKEVVSEKTIGGDDVGVEADGEVSDEAGSPETAVSKPEAVSEKTTGEEEKKDDVEEDGESRLENGSFDGGEKQASTDGIVGGADKEEEKSSLEVGADEKVSNEAASPETASLLSPEQKTVGVTEEENKKVEDAVSEKTTGEDGVGVTEEENKKVEEAVSDKTTGEDDVEATKEESKKVEEDFEDNEQSGLFLSSSFMSCLSKIESCIWKQSFNRLYLLTGKTYASIVAASASKEVATSPEAVSGDSDKGIAGGADKEEKSSLEVGADEKVSDEGGTPDTASLLSPEPEAVSEKTTEENKKVEEGGAPELEAVSDKVTGEDDLVVTQEENKKSEEGVVDVEENGQSGLFLSSFSRIESCLWK